MSDQLVGGRHVDTVDVREANFRCRRGQIDLLRTRFTGHLNNLLRGGATHDGVIHQQHVLIAELSAVGVQLAAHRFTAQLLAWHDKGAANIAVLHEALAIGFTQDARHLQRDIAGGFRDRDDHIDIQIFPLAGNLLAELGAHIHTGAVDGDLVDEGVRTGKVDVLEQARVADRVFRTLTGKQLAFFGDVNRFARSNVTQELKAQGVQGHAFGGHHIFGAAIANIAFTQHQRANPVRIAERDHTVADNHRYAGIGTANQTVSGRHGSKNVVSFQRIVTEVIQFAGKDVKQNFRVRSGVNVATLLFKQLFT